jgi:HSP20 family protein
MALPIRRRSDDLHPGGRPASWPPWNPYAPFDDMYQRMSQFVRALREDSDTGAWWCPPVDVEEADDSFVIEVDLPGVARDDLTIEWSGRELTLHAEVKEREHTGFLRQQARRTGAFHYTVTLPGEVDGDNITADLKDGVLTVRAPKSQTSKRRRIQIGG